MRMRVIAGSLGALLVIATFKAEADPTADPSANAYTQRNLVSNGPISAPHIDPNLVNAWGIAFNRHGVFWVADNGTGVSTLYDGNGVPQPLVVTIPPPLGGEGPSSPTGIVFNDSRDFVVSKGSASAPAAFIFDTEDGTISGWAPAVDPTNAILVIDNSASNAIYKGLAIAANGSGQFLYATDFHNRKIDVFDRTFAPVTLAGHFEDPGIPSDFAPFGIRNINGNLYVTYAKQDAEKEDDVRGPGFGYVDVFDADGRLIRRFASQGPLNAPWGLALAPANFGLFSNRLLIGNFGNGRINAFDLATGEFKGEMTRPNNQRFEINGLWGLSFGNGEQNQPVNVLFFTAGPQNESNGLYGRIEAKTN